MTMEKDTLKLIENIRTGIIGDDRAVEGPFGVRRVTYADYTASGRSLDFIEDFIREEVMSLYANTHTETSTTGLQTTRFREDARRIILEAVHGGDDDVVIFCGSGATGAINKLIEILNLRLPADLDERYGFSGLIPEEERPVVFIGPYEHHSNEISWRETIADVVVIDEDRDGQSAVVEARGTSGTRSALDALVAIALDGTAESLAKILRVDLPRRDDGACPRWRCCPVIRRRRTADRLRAC